MRGAYLADQAATEKLFYRKHGLVARADHREAQPGNLVVVPVD